VDGATAALLEEKTEGWATGLRLAALYLQGHEDINRSARELSGSSRHIAEYLVGEVLLRQSPEIVAYLLETSILDRFCVPLFEAVHSIDIEGPKREGESGAQQFVDWLIETNLFVIPLDDQAYWLRYHHLFQQLLQTLLCRQRGRDAVAGLHMQASNWFDENGLIEEAIRHALAAGETQAAVRLVVRHRYDLINRSEFHRLDRQLELLPANVVAENPLLVTTKALLGIELSRHSDMYACTKQAQRMLAALPQESAEHAVLQGEVAALQCVLDVISGESASIFRHAQCALQQLPAEASLARSLSIGATAASHQMEGDLKQGVKVVKDALAESVWPTGIRARMYFYLCIANYMDANLGGVVFWARESLQSMGDVQLPHMRNLVQYFLGAVHYLRNEPAKAEPYVLSTLNDRAISNPSYAACAGFIVASIHLSRRRAAEAERVIDLLSVHFREIGHAFGSVLTEAFRVELALQQGKIDEARRLSVSVDFDPRPPIWFHYVPQLTLTKLLLAEGTPESLENARASLESLDDQMRKSNRKSVRIDVLALQSLVLDKLGDEAAALEALRAALALAEPGGFIRNFVDLGVPMANLLGRLNESGAGNRFIREVLAACAAQACQVPQDAHTETSAGSVAGKPGEISVLTPREQELLSLVAVGLSNKEIASKLYIAVETVKTHLQRIYRKLDADGRISAVKRAEELGINIRD